MIHRASVLQFYKALTDVIDVVFEQRDYVVCLVVYNVIGLFMCGVRLSSLCMDLTKISSRKIISWSR